MGLKLTLPSVCALFQVRTGFLMNLMGVFLLNLAINTWAQTIFQLGTFPDWAHNHSTTVTKLSSALVNNSFKTL